MIDNKFSGLRIQTGSVGYSLPTPTQQEQVAYFNFNVENFKININQLEIKYLWSSR